MIFIDAGHGGHDSGATGHGLLEKDICLHVARQVAALLDFHCLAASLTRCDDGFVSLEDRVKQANSSGANVFISIHCNSAEVDTANGFESFIFTGSKTSKPLQDKMHAAVYDVCKKYGMRDRGKKEAGYYVIKNTKCPAILLELGFINNASDAKNLADDQFLYDCAVAIANSCADFLGNY